jgi:hypothetical protein
MLFQMNLTIEKPFCAQFAQRVTVATVGALVVAVLATGLELIGDTSAGKLKTAFGRERDKIFLMSRGA